MTSRPAADLLAEAALHLSDVDARQHRRRAFQLYLIRSGERCPLCTLLVDIAEHLKTETKSHGSTGHRCQLWCCKP